MSYTEVVQWMREEFQTRMSALSAHYISIVGEFSAGMDKENLDWDNSWKPGFNWTFFHDHLSLYQQYFKTIARVAAMNASGGLMYQWHCSYDNSWPYHTMSYENLANYGFNDLYMKL